MRWAIFSVNSPQLLLARDREFDKHECFFMRTFFGTVGGIVDVVRDKEAIGNECVTMSMSVERSTKSVNKSY